MGVIETHKSEKARPRKRKASEPSGHPNLRKGAASVGSRYSRAILILTSQFSCLTSLVQFLIQLICSQTLCSFVSSHGYSVGMPVNSQAI